MNRTATTQETKMGGLALLAWVCIGVAVLGLLAITAYQAVLNSQIP